MTEQLTVTSLLENEIKDLYSAEKQLTKALPKMVSGSNDKALKQALLAHLKETENQVKRLEQAAELLSAKPTGKKCKGMEGVIEEGAEALKQEGDPPVVDLGIIAAGSRVEHYEISGYKTAISLAQRIGSAEVVSLLKESLGEEEAAEKTLRKLAGGMMKAAGA